MSLELLYTSAPQGLKRGTRGFATVLSTQGLPVNLASRLEALSAYRHVHPPGSPQADSNPVNHSHIRMKVGGHWYSVLSRVADFGFDYSQRSNKIAHHVVIDDQDQQKSSPTAILRSETTMRSSWDNKLATPVRGPSISPSSKSAKPCQHWKQVTGHAEWAAVVAERFAARDSKVLSIVFDLHQAPLLIELMDEAVNLLPPNQRWTATFSTYAVNLPPDVECKVRCLLKGTDEAKRASVRPNCVDLTLPLAVPPVNEFTKRAIEGQSFPTAPTPAPNTFDNVIFPNVVSETPQVEERDNGREESLINNGDFLLDEAEFTLKEIEAPYTQSSHANAFETEGAFSNAGSFDGGEIKPPALRTKALKSKRDASAKTIHKTIPTGNWIQDARLYGGGFLLILIVTLSVLILFSNETDTLNRIASSNLPVREEGNAANNADPQAPPGSAKTPQIPVDSQENDKIAKGDESNESLADGMPKSDISIFNDSNPEVRNENRTARGPNGQPIPPEPEVEVEGDPGVTKQKEQRSLNGDSQVGGAVDTDSTHAKAAAPTPVKENDLANDAPEPDDTSNYPTERADISLLFGDQNAKVAYLELKDKKLVAKAEIVLSDTKIFVIYPEKEESKELKGLALDRWPTTAQGNEEVVCSIRTQEQSRGDGFQLAITIQFPESHREDIQDAVNDFHNTRRKLDREAKELENTTKLNVDAIKALAKFDPSGLQQLSQVNQRAQRIVMEDIDSMVERLENKLLLQLEARRITEERKSEELKKLEPISNALSEYKKSAAKLSEEIDEILTIGSRIHLAQGYGLYPLLEGAKKDSTILKQAAKPDSESPIITSFRVMLPAIESPKGNGLRAAEEGSLRPNSAIQPGEPMF